MATGRVLIDQLNARENWLEVYKAINDCLPHEGADVNEADIELRHRMKVLMIKVEKLPDLTAWYAKLQPTSTVRC